MFSTGQGCSHIVRLGQPGIHTATVRYWLYCVHHSPNTSYQSFISYHCTTLNCTDTHFCLDPCLPLSCRGRTDRCILRLHSVRTFPQLARIKPILLSTQLGILLLHKTNTSAAADEEQGTRAIVVHRVDSVISPRAVHAARGRSSSSTEAS